MSATEIGRRLKKARLDAGLTQKDAADRLGITYQAISNYERGINRVDTDTLTRLCRIYGIQISDLLSTPAWDTHMLAAYRNATSDEERQNYIHLWGCPAELIEAENNRREPDLHPLTPEDELVLYAYHNGKFPMPKKAPTENGERQISNDELKFALWGDCDDIDEDDLADVLKYAAFVRERKKKK